MSDKTIVLVLIPISSPRQSDQGDRKIQSKNSTAQYCQGWDNIFGTKQPVAQA